MDDVDMAESLRARAATFASLEGAQFSMDAVSGRALNNQVWRVDTGHEVFALRVPPAMNVLGIDRTAEAWALRAAADAGASPRLVDSDPAAGCGPRVLTHLDPWPNNFLDDGTRLWLVDWEFASATDGMSDIAVLAMSAGIPADGIRDGAADHLLDLFDQPEERERLVAACGNVTLFEVCWALAAHAGHGSDGQFDYRAHAERLLLQL